ncbi:MAG: sigma-54-dependent Fis family transcriptional regulator [Gammaproteobacteria bacterium]|nr:sigma-54-dependent Fis family transcriptional regulator [Gammaproteobacteria bacterium]
MDTILIIDDNPAVCTALELLFSLHGWRTRAAATPEEGLALAGEPGVALVVQDMNFTADTTSGAEGQALFRALRARNPDLPIILMTAWTHLETAVDLVRSGAADYIGKPWDDRKLVTTVNNLLELSGLRREHSRRLAEQKRGREALRERADLAGLVYESEAMHELARIAVQVARADVPVLITGESGVGKEKFAEILHANSRRKTGPFIKTNCGALPVDLLEAELFGAEAGAYTGANKARAGRFELADGGSLFLDEIGTLPLPGQVKLLRVLQSGEYERLGAGKTLKTDVRIIAATNSRLKTAMEAGEFREDVYFRLNVIELAIPPLRERREDILPLARHFLGETHQLSPAAERALLAHDWPGNVRELENTLARARLLAGGPCLEPADLGMNGALRLAPDADWPPEAEELDAERLRDALAAAEGSVSRAARDLGLSRQALYRRMEKHGLNGV